MYMLGCILYQSNLYRAVFSWGGDVCPKGRGAMHSNILTSISTGPPPPSSDAFLHVFAVP